MKTYLKYYPDLNTQSFFLQDENPLNPSPSQVVHVRGLAENILEQDLKEAVQHFGTVK